MNGVRRLPLPGSLRKVARKIRTAAMACPMASAALAKIRDWEGQWCNERREPGEASRGAALPGFEEFFDSRTVGKGLWKWRHYFDVYERHLRKFAGRRLRLLEVGIFSGGSIDMWQGCLGSGCEIVGVDIEPACRAYERPGVRVFVGDQANRGFWQTVEAAVGPVDVVIDDGGHQPRQQITTLEEMLPSIRPGGVYICEDVHGIDNSFMLYLSGLLRGLNAATPETLSAGGTITRTTDFQRAVHSIHVYPYVVAIERNESPRLELTAPRHGTEWQPFL